MLLDKLAKAFADGGYQLRPFLKLLVESTAYQLSSGYEGDWSPDYIPLFARHREVSMGPQHADPWEHVPVVEARDVIFEECQRGDEQQRFVQGNVVAIASENALDRITGIILGY